jgi:glycosyltransferase involved in cell wall biosynthesis
MERWLIGRSDLVVSSAGLASRVRRLVPSARVREWRFPSSALHADPNEVLAVRERLALAPDAPVVLYSGTFESYQGLPDLLGAMPLVRERVPGATLVLVGADQANGLGTSREAQALIQSGALRIVDRQPREAMAAYLLMADVLVSPRAYGGNLPLKVFDYLSAGRPIVATDIPTHRTVLAEDRAVLVAPESGAIARGIVALLRDRAQAARLARNARVYAEQHLGWRGFVRDVDQLYHQVQRHNAVARG